MQEIESIGIPPKGSIYDVFDQDAPPTINVVYAYGRKYMKSVSIEELVHVAEGETDGQVQSASWVQSSSTEDS